MEIKAVNQDINQIDNVSERFIRVYLRDFAQMVKKGFILSGSDGKMTKFFKCSIYTNSTDFKFIKNDQYTVLEFDEILNVLIYMLGS